jgi:hypothetical protein
LLFVFEVVFEQLGLFLKLLFWGLFFVQARLELLQFLYVLFALFG